MHVFLVYQENQENAGFSLVMDQHLIRGSSELISESVEFDRHKNY